MAVINHHEPVPRLENGDDEGLGLLGLARKDEKVTHIQNHLASRPVGKARQRAAKVHPRPASATPRSQTPLTNWEEA